MIFSIHIQYFEGNNHILRDRHIRQSPDQRSLLLSTFRYMVSQYPNKIQKQTGEPQHRWDWCSSPEKWIGWNCYQQYRYWMVLIHKWWEAPSVPAVSSFSDHWPMPSRPQKDRQDRCCAARAGRELSRRDFHSPARSPNVPALRNYESLGQTGSYGSGHGYNLSKNSGRIYVTYIYIYTYIFGVYIYI